MMFGRMFGKYMSGSSPEASASSGHGETESREFAAPWGKAPSDEAVSEAQIREWIAATGKANPHYMPLPPPEILEAYEAILPGSAQEIMEMSKTGMNRHHRNARIAQYRGMAIACVAIIVSCITAVYSQTWYHALAAVLIAAVGVGIPTVGQAFLAQRMDRK